MATVPVFSFTDFVRKFPPVEPPITLGEDTHHVFSRENEPLPGEMIEHFIRTAVPNNQDDEFTEYVPCLTVETTEKYIALIWWRAGLMTYEYVLATYTPAGEPIQHRTIAGTRVLENRIQRAVAKIDEESIIWIAQGAAGAELDGLGYDTGSSIMSSLEILANGMIV